ncbi:altronate dehydratase [Bacteroides sp. 214]|uniref:UxaA family hydrolase n=1 Tax=Bacteroides sp. 214 TaxID=2302935 RepID=UPI0013D59D32|nr:altronate dehydratase family protein [Bacteroides sp. 214]NDW12726.1 altronate dehydratase [Bacteroides sp. 214]
MTTTKILQINPADNVAVAIINLSKGEQFTINGTTITLTEDVPAGHKFALKDFTEGEDVIKYGYPIGHTTKAKKVGDWMNENCIKTNLAGLLEYTYNPIDVTLDIPQENLTFKGYRRKNGEVGIRNEVWIIPTVGCVNGTVNELAEALRKETGGKGVDAIVAYPHNYGCSQLGDDHENTKKILRDMVLHPNAGAVLVVGLGCENNQPEVFEQFLGEYDKERVKFIVTQKVHDEFEEGMTILRDLYAIASQDKRTDVPLSELKVGLKCGGSDGFSGITANPLLGVFSDFLIAQGGTSILTEVPEMFGAETILMNRCANTQLFDQTVHLINDFKEYFLSHGEPVGENPSPGNKAGGISTLEEKALGCTQKCGKSIVNGVLSYGERLQVKGLNLLSAPGNDLVAATALASSGSHIVLFTTGRGTPFGTYVPTMKISTNTALANNKPTWIDFNAGVIVEGESMESTCRRFIDYIIKVASGEFVNNEKKGYREIAIFKTGVTL